MNKICCCRPPRGQEMDPPSFPLQTPPQQVRPAASSSAASPGSSHSASEPRSVGYPGQPNMCLVSCGCEWHRGQFSVV